MISNKKLINILTQLNNWCISNCGNINTDYLQSLTLTEQVSQLFWIIKEFGNQINTTIDGFNELYKFVNDYFENLDVQNEINNKLNEMSKNGELSKIIYPMVINVASPVFVDSESQMIDENRIYVLNNSGMIYYWNGKTFINSGVKYGAQLNNFTYNGLISGEFSLSDYRTYGFYLCLDGSVPSDYPEMLPKGLFCLINYTSSSGDGLQLVYVMGKNSIASRVVGNTITDWTYCYNSNIVSNSPELSTLTEPGYIYYIVSAGDTKPSDFPKNANFLTSLILNFTFQSSDGYYGQQFLYDITARKIYSRTISTDGGGEWMEGDTNGGFNGYIPSTHETLLSAYNNSGYYIHTTSVSGYIDYTDFPERIPKTNFILVNKTDGQGNGKQLIISMFSGDIASRAIGYDWTYQYFGTPSGQTLFTETLLDYTGPGYFYYVVSSDSIKPSDWPSEIPFETTMIINQSFYSSSGYYGMQFIIPANNNAIARRYFSTNYASDWLIIKNYKTIFGAPTSKWLALGDSITAGVYSWKNEDGSSSRTQTGTKYNYANLISEWYNNAVVDNKAILGLGYAFTDSNPERNIVNIIDSIDNWDYDLISIMLGTNDYYSQSGQIGTKSSEAGDGTISGNCRYCIEKIMRENPSCRLVILSPLNMKTGDISTKYALNKQNSKGFTLIEEMNIIKYWCEYYGIEFINMTTECSEVNVLNINTAIADSVHPTKETNVLIAKSLATKLHFI